jgi:hypothetical protein
MNHWSLNAVTSTIVRAGALAVFLGAVLIGVAPDASAASHKSSKRIVISAVSSSSQQVRNNARRGIDGRLDTRWTAVDGTYPQWIKLDIGAVRVVDKVNLYWYRHKTHRYTHLTETSVDGTHWKRFASGTRVRFVRVRLLSCSVPTTWASIRDIRLSTSRAAPKPGPKPKPKPTPAPAPTPATPVPEQPKSPDDPPLAAPTTAGHLVLRGAHDVTYNNVTFRGAGSNGPDSSGVIEISGASHDVTFVYCTIERNGDGVGNGVKIVDTGSGMHDITFRNCLFKGQPRMGFECIGRGSSNGYQRVDLINCTFEPQGSEAISYDDDSGSAGECLISGNLVKGAGTNAAYSWGQGFEINSVRNMTAINNTFYRCRGDVWNLNGPSGNCGWNLSDNVIDTGQGTVASSSSANPVAANNVSGGIFARNRITNSISWAIAYFSACHNMDWRGTVWSGPNSTPAQVNGSSGNLF